MQEKKTRFGGIAVNYKIVGGGEIPVVLLHGWGVSSDRYVGMAQEALRLDDRFRFYIPDLPGFGKSDEPEKDWTIDDYVAFAKDFIDKASRRESGFELVKNIIEGAVRNDGNVFGRKDKKVIMIAHSFGGRIAIKYAAKYPDDVGILFLTGAAGIKHPLGRKKRFLRLAARSGKTLSSLPGFSILERYARILLYRIARERDYVSASVRMKGVMRNALAEDLTPLLSEIEVPTFIVWGENDRSTPLEDGHLMEKKIVGSKLFVLAEANHSAVYNNAGEFAAIFVDCVRKHHEI